MWRGGSGSNRCLFFPFQDVVKLSSTCISSSCITDEVEEDENEDSLAEERASDTFSSSFRNSGWEVEFEFLDAAIVNKVITLLTSLRIEELDDGVQLYGKEKEEVKLAAGRKTAAGTYLQSFLLILRSFEDTTKQGDPPKQLTWRNLKVPRKGGGALKRASPGSLKLKQKSLRGVFAKMTATAGGTK